MTLYYLPCSCGKKIEVDAGQSGLNVHCQCGADLTVPTMRGLKQLEPVEAPSEAVAAETQQANWGARQGVVFLGLVVLLGALLPGLFAWYNYPQRPQLFRTDFKELNAEEIEQASLPETWELWKELHQGFEMQGEHPQMQAYMAAEKQAREKLTVICVAGAIGLAIIIGGLFIKPPPAR
ncbi:MAG TPA: hypothetical protein VHC19_20890 [Pirellulales bacterium]|nr:hypothetical protein [Pirellulales bacterium]